MGNKNSQAKRSREEEEREQNRLRCERLQREFAQIEQRERQEQMQLEEVRRQRVEEQARQQQRVEEQARQQQRAEAERQLEQQRVAEKAQKQRVKEQARQLALQRAEAERQRKLQELEDFITSIDYFIRTRKMFNSAHPLAYRCGLSTVISSCDADKSADLTDSTYSIIQSCGSFVVDGDHISVRYLTPFQGHERHRVFGKFKCSKCARTWASAGSWKSSWQKCKSCDVIAYPYAQNVLEDSDHHDNDDDEKRPHDTTRCQRCIDLGRLCLPDRYYAV